MRTTLARGLETRAVRDEERPEPALSGMQAVAPSPSLSPPTAVGVTVPTVRRYPAYELSGLSIPDSSVMGSSVPDSVVPGWSVPDSGSSA